MVHSQSNDLRVAVVGATGIVGQHIMALLECANPDQHIVPIDDVAGEFYSYHGDRLRIRSVEGFDFSQVDLVFFATTPAISKQLILHASAGGCTVIDSSSCFRLQPDVPLVMPAINSTALGSQQLIAAPCSATATILKALAPLSQRFGMKRMTTSMWVAMQLNESAAVSMLEDPPSRKGGVGDLRLYGAIVSAAVVRETRKILLSHNPDDPTVPIEVSCRTIPRPPGLTAAVSIETQETITPAAARAALRESEGVELVGDFPHKVFGCTTPDRISVGRFSENQFSPRGLTFWVQERELARRTAFNAVEIAEHIFGGPSSLVLRGPNPRRSDS